MSMTRLRFALAFATIIPAIVLFNAPAPAQGDAAPPGAASPPIDLNLARQYFAEVKAIAEKDDGALWGRPLDGPMLFVDRATRFVAANARDSAGVLDPAGEGLFTGVLPAEINVANTSIDWGGRVWSTVVWPPPADETRRKLLMMHERFHAVQRSMDLELAMRDNHHLDAADGRTWMRLEWRALAAALESGEEPGESKAVRDALIFRAYRRALAPKAANEERDLELNEGLAEYTGVRLCGADDATQREIAVSSLRMYDRMDNFVRSFAYASGPGWGLLLDESMPDWRKRIRAGVDLGELLRRAIRFRLPDDLAAEAESRAERYGGDDVIAAETAREEARRERLAGYRERFVTGPVLIIRFDGATRFSFDPYDIHALDGLGTVYGSMRITGPWGVCESAGSVLVVEEPSGRKQFRLPAPGDPGTTPIEGDGWTLTLEPGWRLRQISSKGNYLLERGL